jgi:glycosyltransferase involved in cell wall biosynthesis
LENFRRRDQRIVLLRNPENLKISRALNRGIACARGEFIARMDADDVSLPNRFATQIAFMDAQPAVGIVGGSMRLIDTTGRRLGERFYAQGDFEIRKKIFRFSPFSHPTILLRKAVLDLAGYYNPEFDFAEDYELYFRIGRLTQFGNVPEIVLEYRVLENSITHQRIALMEKKTLFIRYYAVAHYGYRMKWSDYLYLLAHRLSRWILPGRVRIWIFRMLRDRK